MPNLNLESKEINGANKRTKSNLKASIIGLVINILLFISKFVIGIITLSNSIISDAINNLSDFFSCFLNIFGIKISSKPSDKEHPFGHERIEYIASLIISIVIILSAVILVYDSIMELIRPTGETKFNLATFLILGLSIGIKLILFAIYRLFYHKTKSIALKTSSLDSIFDCFSTSAILIASIVQFYYPNIWYLDKVMSLLVSIILIYEGIKLLIDIANPLIGGKIDRKLALNIIKDVSAYKGILGVHDLIIHSYGQDRNYVVLHCEIDGYRSLFDAHELIDKIEYEIGDKYHLNLTIHIDPVDTKNKNLKNEKKEIEDYLKSIYKDITIHDFQIDDREGRHSISFDILISYCEEDISKRIYDLAVKKAAELKPNYEIKVKIDENLLEK